MKKIFCLVMAIAMIAALAVTTSAAEIPEDGLIAHFTFDDAESGLTSNGVVATPVNAEGETDAVIVADGHDGGAIDFGLSSDSNHWWLELANEDGSGILDGVESFTISYWSNNDAADVARWMFYAAPANEDGTAAITQEYLHEHYIGILEKATTLTGEFYNCDGARTHSTSSSFLSANEWQLVTLTFDAETGELYFYINGEFDNGTVVTSENHTVADILTDSYKVYVGYATWGSGEYAFGLMDDLYIYNRALSEDEIVEFATAQGVEGLVSSGDEGTDTPEGTEAPDNGTEAPADNGTDAPTTTAAAGTDAAEEGGCGSTLGAAAAIVALTTVFGCAIVKKH